MTSSRKAASQSIMREASRRPLRRLRECRTLDLQLRNTRRRPKSVKNWMVRSRVNCCFSSSHRVSEITSDGSFAPDAAAAASTDGCADIESTPRGLICSAAAASA